MLNKPRIQKLTHVAITPVRSEQSRPWSSKRKGGEISSAHRRWMSLRMSLMSVTNFANYVAADCGLHRKERVVTVAMIKGVGK